jgi:ABC-type amino acid transport substrate-binding protein
MGMGIDQSSDITERQSTGTSRRRMLVAGAGAVVASTLAGCSLTKGDDDDAADSGSPAAAESSAPQVSALDQILDRKVVRFGVDLSFKPLQFRDPKTNEPTGYSVEVAKLLADALGAKPEWVEVPFQEIVSAQAAGRFDLSGIQAVNTAERAQQVAFAFAPSFLEGTYLFQRKGLGLGRTSELDDGDITIAVLAGSAQAQTAKLLFPKAKLKELPDDTAATADVTTDRSDALFIGDYAVGDASRKGLELISPEPVAVAWNTFFLPQGDVALHEFVTTFLHNKASDLTLANLWEQFVAGEINRYGVRSAAVKDPYLTAAYA